MTIADMPVGSTLVMGVYRQNGSGTVDMEWVKVSSNNEFMNKMGMAMEMDGCEPHAKNRYRRACGSNFYPHMNIHQFLNASGKDWFAPADEGDAPPRTYVEWSGFLDNFTPLEKASLMQQEVTVAVPDGYRREFGDVTKVECLVTVPSASQVVPNWRDLGFADEGDTFEYIRNPQDVVWYQLLTRTALHSGVALKDRSDVKRYSPSAVGYCVHPLIRIRPDALLADAPDDARVYYLCEPDEVRQEWDSAFVSILNG